MEKNLYKKFVPFRLLLVLSLIIALLPNSILSQVCFCGKNCSHDFQIKVNANAEIPLHARCAEAQCKSCRFEDVQSLKASNNDHLAEKIKTFNSLLLISNFLDLQVRIDLISSFTCYLFEYINFQSPPTYLKILSLLL
jgi:hypothetical protein